jgi:hypothetical protein
MKVLVFIKFFVWAMESKSLRKVEIFSIILYFILQCSKSFQKKGLINDEVLDPLKTIPLIQITSPSEIYDQTELEADFKRHQGKKFKALLFLLSELNKALKI